MRAFGVVFLAAFVVVGGFAVLDQPAHAATLGYPAANAVTFRVGKPYPEWWIDENADGRKQVPGELFSSRGYPYRNSADYVAWLLRTLGVPAGITRELHSPSEWAASAAGRAGIAVRDTPVRFGVAVEVRSPGQVAFVDDVLADGRITVDEYNADNTGQGRTWTGTPQSRGFSKYLDFGLSTGRVPGSPIAIARNADGRLEAFGVANDGSALHKWQLNPGGLWSGWASFNGNFASIAAETNADGRIEVTAIGTNGIVSDKRQNTPGGTWSAWATAPGRLASIALARGYDGRLVAFGTNAAQVAYERTQLTVDGSWSAWTVLARGFTNIAADTNADGRVEVFGVATNGAVSHAWQATPGGAWSPWETIEGGLTSIAVVRNFDGRLQLFATNAAHAVYTKAQTTAGGAWAPWIRLTGRLDNVAAETSADGRVEVFGVSANGVVYHATQYAPGAALSPWAKIDGALRP